MLAASIILFILWFLGVVGVYSVGWIIHLTLVFAVILLVLKISGTEETLS